MNNVSWTCHLVRYNLRRWSFLLNCNVLRTTGFPQRRRNLSTFDFSWLHPNLSIDALTLAVFYCWTYALSNLNLVSNLQAKPIQNNTELKKGFLLSRFRGAQSMRTNKLKHGTSFVSHFSREKKIGNFCPQSGMELLQRLRV